MTANMVYDKPVADLVRKRYSCRSYDGRGLEPGTLEALEKFPLGLALPFKNQLRFGIIDKEKVRAENMFSTGSYGMIRGVRFYLSALTAKDARRCWEDIGYALEATVLYATALDLGTCWIGGIFDRKHFGRSLGMGDGEILPAVVAVGRPAEKRSLRDRLVRWSAKGDMRKDPAAVFFSNDWQTPFRYADSPPWATVLENVRLAPSASNKQPWRIIAKDGGFHFFLDRDKAYSAMMPHVDLQRIDLGIAMCHFQLSAQESGLAGEWRSEEPLVDETPANFEYIVSFAIQNSLE